MNNVKILVIALGAVLGYTFLSFIAFVLVSLLLAPSILIIFILYNLFL